MTIQAYNPALISGALVIPCIIRWLWETDRPVAVQKADVGAGIILPTYVTGPSTHGWWATVILLIVIFMIFLMTIFSWFFVYGIHPAYWGELGDPMWLIPILGGYGTAAALILLGRWLLTREKSTHWSPATQILLAAAAIFIAFAIDLWSWREAGLDPELTSQAALIMAFICQQGMLVAVSMVMALYLGARNARAMITRPRNVTFDVVVLFMLYTAAQGSVTALLTRLFPGGF